MLCVPLGFVFASFFNFLNCLAHNACALTCSSKTILGKYLKPVVSLAEDLKMTNKKSIERQSQTHFHLVHYADAPFRSYEDRLTSNVWQAAMRLRKHKVSVLIYEILGILSYTFSFFFKYFMGMLIMQKIELEALIRRLRSSSKVNSNA